MELFNSINIFIYIIIVIFIYIYMIVFFNGFSKRIIPIDQCTMSRGWLIRTGYFELGLRPA